MNDPREFEVLEPQALEEEDGCKGIVIAFGIILAFVIVIAIIRWLY